MSLSPAAVTVLTRATERPDHCLQFHRKLPTGGRHKMIDALLREGLIVETLGDYRLGDGATLIEDSATGLMLTTLAVTDAGRLAIGREAPIPTEAHTALYTPPTPSAPHDGGEGTDAVCEPPGRATGLLGRKAPLREAVGTLLAAWDAGADLAPSINALRSAITTTKLPRQATAPRKPREGTKQEAVLTLLRRNDGATIAQIMEATGWQQHTVRGFMAGLKRKGMMVEAIERVRMVGPDKQGSKGSYSIYRLAEAG